MDLYVHTSRFFLLFLVRQSALQSGHLQTGTAAMACKSQAAAPFFLSLSAQFADRGADELYEPFPVCQVIQAEAGLCPLVRRLQHRLP